MVFAVLLLVSQMQEVHGMQVNQPNRDKTLEAILSQVHHPIVRQDENAESTSNNSNPLSFPFQDYKLYESIRKEWGSFLDGMNANYFASNATTCFENTLNLLQYDVELLIVKLMYGSVKNNVLNTTLFFKNISDLSYICLDAQENNYVFWVYKIDSFGRSTT